MKARFNPRATACRAKHLAFLGRGKFSGLVERWDGVNLFGNQMGQIEFANHAAKVLGGDISLNIMLTSSSSLFSETMTRKALEFYCWRVAANTDLLRAGAPVMSWRGLSRPLTSPLQIVHVATGWSRGKVPVHGIKAAFQVIDGLACPVLFARWFPSTFLFVFARELGIGNYRAKRRYSGNPNELYGMRLIATLLDSEYEPGTITFERYAGGQFSGYNRKLMARRAAVCPLGKNWECARCSLGEEDCPDRDPVSRSCRALTLQIRFCRRCNDDRPHDGDDCMKCRNRRPRAAR